MLLLALGIVALSASAFAPALEPVVSGGCPEDTGDPAAAEGADSSFEVALPVNPHELEEARLERVMELAEGARATTITTGAAWWYVAPTEDGPKAWGPMDRLVAEAEERGMGVRLQVSGTPEWVHPYLAAREHGGAETIWYPPATEGERAHFERFLAELVGRYGTRISSYEVWNEPNYDRFWAPRPDPAGYAELLRGAHRAIKGADPYACVVFGGISLNDEVYLDRFYEAAGEYPEAEEERFFFDELSVHPYTYGQSPDDAAEGLPAGASAAAEGDPRDTGPGGLSAMKAVMDSRGDKGKTIFVGEFGYSTEETFMPAVADETRAAHLLRALEITRSLPYVSGLSWYGFVPGSATGPEWTLLDENLSPTETYRALAASEAPPVREREDASHGGIPSYGRRGDPR